MRCLLLRIAGGADASERESGTTFRNHHLPLATSMYLQVLEALHSQRRRGEKGEESSGQAEDNTTTTKEMGSLDPISQSEVLKRAARIIKEGETAVQAKLNSLFRQRRELSNELASAEREQKKLFEAGRTKRQVRFQSQREK
jgi:hypothetical protein